MRSKSVCPLRVWLVPQRKPPLRPVVSQHKRLLPSIADMVSQTKCVKLSAAGTKPHDQALLKYHFTPLETVAGNGCGVVVWPVSVVTSTRGAHANTCSVAEPVGRQASIMRALVQAVSTVLVDMLTL